MSTNNYPSLIEKLDYEAVLEALMNKARAIDGWTAELESDPVLKLLEIVAYRELVLRAHINHVAISNLAQFAIGDDLDAIGEFYQYPRLPDESDARYRKRLFYAIRAMASNGTWESYMAKALGAHIDVIDVVAYRLAPGKVNVAVWGRDDAIAAVKDSLTGEAHEMLGIDVNVFAAKTHTLDVSAQIYVAANAPANIAELVAENVVALSKQEAAFGKPLPRSQIIAWLHANIAGADVVEKAVLLAPTTDLTPAADELWQIGAVAVEVLSD